MRKNNRGFTLIELLAAVVILGILIAIAGPKVLNMVSTNREKIYISDAKKLIAQAEYKIRASSTKIERPEIDDCIVISLVYLDNSDFDNPPNDGEYIREASFVVVKNTGTDLEYSVMLVEKMKKGGYKGVELTTNTDLDKSDAIKHVKVFELKDIVYVEQNDAAAENSSDVISPGFINNQLGDGYIGSIYGVYNYPDLSNSAIQAEECVPEITASLTSTSGKNFRTMDATLNLKATDKDSPRSSLKVYIAFDHLPDTSGEGEEYGTGTVFTRNYDFSQIFPDAAYNGYTIYMYIAVKDPEGNIGTKKLTYVLHTNEPPTINETKSSLTKQTSDRYNLRTATLTLSVSDDIDSNSELEVCLAEGDNVTECNDYHNYKDYFGNLAKYNYTFTCGASSGSNCKLDGSKLYLNVFVRDTGGLVESKKFEYQIYKNQPPVIDNNVMELVSEPEVFTSTGSMNVRLKLPITDDLSSASDLKVNIYQDGTLIVSNVSYANFSNEYYSFKLSGSKYDGSIKKIKVVVTDGEGASSTSNEISYTIYKNKGPEVLEPKIISSGTICNNPSLCPSYIWGSNNAIVSFTLADDLDDSSQLKYCYSETKEDCNFSSNSSNFIAYTSLDNSNRIEILKTDNSSDTDNGDRTIYLVAVDSYGNEGVTEITIPYKVYVNHPPLVNDSYPIIETSGFSRSSDEDNYIDYSVNTFKAKFSLRISDDFDYYDNVNNIKEKICVNSASFDGERCFDETTYSNEKEIDFSQLNIVKYEGQVLNVYAILTDQDGGATTTSEVKYVLYKDEAPAIIDYSISGYEDNIFPGPDGGIDASSIPDTEDETITEDEVNGSYEVDRDLLNRIDVGFIVEDLFDTYRVCVSDAEDGCQNDSEFSEAYSGDILETHVYKKIFTSWTNEGEDSKKIYIFVKDSYGNVTSVKDIPFDEYKMCTSTNNTKTNYKFEYASDIINYTVDSETGEIYSNNNGTLNEKISANRCGGRCYYWPIEYETTLDENNEIVINTGKVIRQPSDTDGIFGVYRSNISYADKYIKDAYCDGVSNDVLVSCGFIDCFYNPNNSNYISKVIGLTKRENTTNEIYSDGTETYQFSEYYRLYTSSYNEGEEMITLTLTTTKIPSDFIGNYAYDSTSSDPYLRASDDYID